MTKNGSARTVPLTRNAVEVIQAALAHSLRPKETDLIFWGDPGRDGTIRPYQFRPAWRQVLQRAGIEEFHFHDLRHEAISRFVEAGLGDQDVAAISGHKSMQMLKRYCSGQVNLHTSMGANGIADILIGRIAFMAWIAVVKIDPVDLDDHRCGHDRISKR